MSMKAIAPLLLASILSPAISADPAPDLVAVESAPAHATGYILVKPKAGVSDETYRAILTRVGAVDYEREEHDLLRKVVVPAGQEQAIADQLATHPLIEWAQPDRVQAPQSMPTEYRGTDWSNPQNLWGQGVQNGYADHWTINSFDAWDITRGAGQVLAIIDGGVNDADPDDLAGKIVQGGSGSTAGPESVHGTHVATTAVAAADNGGTVGVAPEAKVMPFVASTSSNVAASLARAADMGVKVANISMGSNHGLGAWVDSIDISGANYFRSKGGIVINAAGNAQDSTQQSPAAEAAFLFVAATSSGSSYSVAGYSNRGPSIDLCAPEFAANGGGTSNAAPAVSAAAALVWSVNPAFTNVDVEAILKDSAKARTDKPDPSIYGTTCIDKALDVGGAVRLAVERANAAGAADALPPHVEFKDDTPPVVSGVATVDVAAGDDRGLAKVVLLANGQVLGEDLTPPYQFVLDSRALLALGIASGTLTAEAIDLSGKSAQARPLAFSVVKPVTDTTPPTVALLNAQGRKSIAGKTLAAAKRFTATVKGTDNLALDSLRVYVDGVELGTVAASGDATRKMGRYTLDTRTVPNGLHVLKAVAMDGAGNLAQASAKLKVKNLKPRKK
jgi:thermitase